MTTPPPRPTTTDALAARTGAQMTGIDIAPNLIAQAQAGVTCLTPMAWLLALPAGWNYVALAKGRRGQQPFLAGLLLDALLGLLYGALFWVVATYGMPTSADPEEIAKVRNLNLLIAGT